MKGGIQAEEDGYYHGNILSYPTKEFNSKFRNIHSMSEIIKLYSR